MRPPLSDEEDASQPDDDSTFDVEDVQPGSDDYDSGSEGASCSSADESKEEFRAPSIETVRPTQFTVVIGARSCTGGSARLPPR